MCLRHKGIVGSEAVDSQSFTGSCIKVLCLNVEDSLAIHLNFILSLVLDINSCPFFGIGATEGNFSFPIQAWIMTVHGTLTQSVFSTFQMWNKGCSRMLAYGGWIKLYVRIYIARRNGGQSWQCPFFLPSPYSTLLGQLRLQSHHLLMLMWMVAVTCLCFRYVRTYQHLIKTSPRLTKLQSFPVTAGHNE